jgi:pyrimidine operon attenuation protein/uracil phosphoribosyltransferase
MPPNHQPAPSPSSVILDSAQIDVLLEGLQSQIREALAASANPAIVGIKRRGAVLARRLWTQLHEALPNLLFGEVDISLYRDDYHLQNSQPQVLGTEINFNVEGATIVLVDDVLFTGRTVRAALDLILDFGRPQAILLAALVDRGHRELPIAADFVGRRMQTQKQDHVKVLLRELDAADEVLLLKGVAGAGR